MSGIESLPENPDLAAHVVQGEETRKTRRLEMGLIGRIVGDAAEKPGNIALIAILLAVILIVIVIFWAPKDAPTGQLYTLFGGIITLALGYLFGRNT